MPSSPASPLLSFEGMSYLWLCERPLPDLSKIEVITENSKAARARLTSGQTVVWRGDYHQGKVFLASLLRDVEAKKQKPADSITQAFHHYRMRQGQKAALTDRFLIPLEANYKIPLSRAPEVALACREALGDLSAPAMLPLQKLNGILGAHEWRKKGVLVPELDLVITPHYGVFSPTRHEYLSLFKNAPLPKAVSHTSTAFDIGTGTGILSLLLAKRGIQHITATDNAPRAIACALENSHKHRLQNRIHVVHTDIFPEGKAALIVCNPPWLPGKPASELEAAIYDPQSNMLTQFLKNAPKHLLPEGNIWLLLSDLAEHMGLRTREDLLTLFTASGLSVTARLEIPPKPPRAFDKHDPLLEARKKEITSLWILRPKDAL